MKYALLLLAFASSVTFAQTIKGTVDVTPDLSKKAAGDGVLFVIARPHGVQGGPPLAVLRIPNPKFPQAFEIGASNVMAGGEFKGELVLTAKLSKSGDPMTGTGDLLGELAKKGSTVMPGKKDVQVILNKMAP